MKKGVYKIVKEVPNCSICKWKRIYDDESFPYCEAQGTRGTYGAYNNRLCKKLFEKMEEKEK